MQVPCQEESGIALEVNFLDRVIQAFNPAEDLSVESRLFRHGYYRYLQIMVTLPLFTLIDVALLSQPSTPLSK